jgi:hypothetical protein
VDVGEGEEVGRGREKGLREGIARRDSEKG